MMITIAAIIAFSALKNNIWYTDRGVTARFYNIYKRLKGYERRYFIEVWSGWAEPKVLLYHVSDCHLLSLRYDFSKQKCSTRKPLIYKV